MNDVVANIDKTAWALMLISVSINILAVVVQYIFKELPAAFLGVISLVCVALFITGVWLAYLGYGQPVVQSAPPSRSSTQEGNAAPKPPGIESIFPPQSAIDVRPMPGSRTVSFILADWVSWSASDISVSTWMSTGGGFEKIGSHRYDYLGNGDSIPVTESVAAQTPSKIALCISYILNKHHVEAIHFFSNADSAGYRRARDAIFEVDGSGNLCASMPLPAQGAL
jgi:hypothetical protein